MKKYIPAVVLAFSATFLAGCAAPAASAKPSVLLQVSEGDSAKWNLALNNAKNVQNEYGGADKVNIEIVAFGPGIGMLKADATTSNRITEAAKSGIAIVACENTMTAQQLSKADMNASISYVHAGVVQIMKRQYEGWAYVRP